MSYGYGTKKVFLLHGHSHDIAQRIQDIALGHPKMSKEEIDDAQNSLSLFTGTLISFPGQGEADINALCPELYEDDGSFYLIVPVSDLSGLHVTPRDASEITDQFELDRLNALFQDRTHLVFMHQHSLGPHVIESDQEDLYHPTPEI